MNGIPLFEQGDARDALKKRCREAKIPIKLLEDLVEVEVEQIGKQKRRRARFGIGSISCLILHRAGKVQKDRRIDRVSPFDPTPRLESIR